MNAIPFDRVINVSQLIALVGGLWWIGVEAGKRDERLAATMESVSELRSIVTDLTKTQIAGATQAGATARELDSLRARIERMESERSR
jgi:uncharacterized phage protein gp47/JayE